MKKTLTILHSLFIREFESLPSFYRFHQPLLATGILQFPVSQFQTRQFLPEN